MANILQLLRTKTSTACDNHFAIFALSSVLFYRPAQAQPVFDALSTFSSCFLPVPLTRMRADVCVCVCVCADAHFSFLQKVNRSLNNSFLIGRVNDVRSSAEVGRHSSSFLSSCQQQYHLQNYMYAFVPITFKLLILYTCTHRSILKKSCINLYFEIRRHVPHFFCQFGPARVTAGPSSSSVSFFIFLSCSYER